MSRDHVLYARLTAAEHRIVTSAAKLARDDAGNPVSVSEFVSTIAVERSRNMLATAAANRKRGSK